MIKIQLALDMFKTEDAFRVLDQVIPYVDIIEAGTPFIKYQGISIIERLVHLYPEKEILADLKTMDAGQYESEPFYAAGASICTVLGAADDDTISGVIRNANDYGKMAQVDLINVPNKASRARTLSRLGAHIIGIHTGIDQQNRGMTPFEDMKELGYNKGLKISVAGGIRPEGLYEILAHLPHIVVVGGAITSAQHPKDVAESIYQIIRDFESEL